MPGKYRANEREKEWVFGLCSFANTYVERKLLDRVVLRGSSSDHLVRQWCVLLLLLIDIHERKRDRRKREREREKAGKRASERR